MSEDDILPGDPAPSDGVGRRALIKRAAAAGAVAWTAPLIVDSLASPAAAATVATGCYRAQRNRNGCAQQAITNSILGCNPTGWSGTGYPESITVVGCSPPASGTTTFEIPADTNCVFVRGQITGGAFCLSGCINGVLSMAGKRISFSGTKCNVDNSAYRLIISCGGATC